MVVTRIKYHVNNSFPRGIAMIWFNCQPFYRKVLLGGAILGFAAGISARGAGIIGGTFLFLLCSILAIFLPRKFKMTKEERQWKKLISPTCNSQEKKLKTLLNVIIAIVFMIVVYFLFQSEVDEKYLLSGVCAIIILIIFTSWCYINPKYFNEIYLNQKIVPLKTDLTLDQLYEKVESLQTPFGTPLIGLVPGLDHRVIVYRIIDLQWIVYFYIDENEIKIMAKRLSKERTESPRETEWIFTFTQQLADLLSFIQNTKREPNDKELVRIFKVPFSRNAI